MADAEKLTGVLPAHAGMIPNATRESASALRAPRTCGDDPGVMLGNVWNMPCSPHMRG